MLDTLTFLLVDDRVTRFTAQFHDAQPADTLLPSLGLTITDSSAAGDGMLNWCWPGEGIQELCLFLAEDGTYRALRVTYD